MSQVPIGGCVLDWERRKGFLPGSRIIAETAHWYVIGYTDDGTPSGALVEVSINSKQHIADLHLMPKKGSGDELIELYGLARQALGLVDGEASNIAANIGTAPSGVMIEGHLHIKLLRAPADAPSSGMGFALLRRMFNRFYWLLDHNVAQYELLVQQEAPVERFVALTRSIRRRLDAAKAEKAGKDAFRRTAK